MSSVNSAVPATAGIRKTDRNSHRHHGVVSEQGNTIANAMDGNAATFFDAPSGVQGWVGLDLGSAELITQVQYVPRNGFSSRMVGGMFQGSSTADFSSGVTTLCTVAQSPAGNAYTAAPISSNAAFRYVRYLSPLTGSGNVAELEFDGIASVATAAPDSPSITAATAVASNDVHLSWTQDNAQPVTTFFIERQGPNDSQMQPLASVGGTASSYDDLTVAPDTQYSYAIYAENTVGDSDLSTAATITTLAASVVPVKLTGTVIGTPGSYRNQGNVAANAFDGKLPLSSTLPRAAAAGPGWIWVRRRRSRRSNTLPAADSLPAWWAVCFRHQTPRFFLRSRHAVHRLGSARVQRDDRRGGRHQRRVPIRSISLANQRLLQRSRDRVRRIPRRRDFHLAGFSLQRQLGQRRTVSHRAG